MKWCDNKTEKGYSQIKQTQQITKELGESKKCENLTC